MSKAIRDLNTPLTERLAQQVVDLRPEAIPERALRIAQMALLDWCAVSFAGTHVDPVPILARDIAGERAAPRVRMVGLGESTSPALAALYNGTAGHVLDYDDVHNAVPGHVTINIAPVVFALAEDRGASGREMLTAFVAGFEQMCRIGLGFQGNLFHRGWQGTTTGAIAAAAAGAKLLKLDVKGTQHAMALAVAQASGVHGNYGSMSKSLNVGLAAQAGLRAAVWAAEGMTGALDILERQKGFVEVYSDSFNPEVCFAEPQGGWHLYRNLFKLHASCFLTHATLQAWAMLSGERAFAQTEIARIELYVEAEKHRIVLTDPPSNGLQAKFNLRFCLAMAIMGIDTSDPASFSAETTSRQDVHDLAQSIEIHIDPAISFEAARLDITLVNGRKISAYRDAGAPEVDLDALLASVEGKARRLLSALPEPERERLIKSFRDIPSLANIDMLHPAISAVASRSGLHE